MVSDIGVNHFLGLTSNKHEEHLMDSIAGAARRDKALILESLELALELLGQGIFGILAAVELLGVNVADHIRDVHPDHAIIGKGSSELGKHRLPNKGI